MENFVDKASIVRDIWGKSDTILFIFAGASAEFALNNAVDWLYFTGKLPHDPLRRLFSTIAYARQIVFSDLEGANKAIENLASLHASAETPKGSIIPDWAYHDVIFMLIDYSIRAYELLERRLNDSEKAEIYAIFLKVGQKMGLTSLPESFEKWQIQREIQLNQNLRKTSHTSDLYKQYFKHLGTMRCKLLLEAQAIIVPPQVKKLLQLNNVSLITPALQAYKLSRIFKMDWLMKALILPARYKDQINALNTQTS